MATVDCLINVVFATQWNKEYVTSDEPWQRLTEQEDPLIATTIPWEITFYNLHTCETFVMIPRPESVLTMGLVYLNDNEIFEPRAFSNGEYIGVDLNGMDEIIEALANGSDPHPKDSKLAKTLFSWQLFSKTIGVINRSSLEFLKKYFKDVVLLNTPLHIPKPMPLDDMDIADDFENVDFVEKLLAMLDEDTEQAKKICEGVKKDTRRRSKRLQKKKRVHAIQRLLSQ